MPYSRKVRFIVALDNKPYIERVHLHADGKSATLYRMDRATVTFCVGPAQRKKIQRGSGKLTITDGMVEKYRIHYTR